MLTTLFLTLPCSTCLVNTCKRKSNEGSRGERRVRRQKGKKECGNREEGWKGGNNGMWKRKRKGDRGNLTY